jgi:hypothetical protein
MADPTFDTVKREPLFPDWDGPDTFPFTDFGIEQRLGRIRKIEAAVERLKKQQADADEWYRSRFLKLAEAEGRLQTEIFQALREIGEKSCATPYGTAFIRKSTTTIWPEDALILEWVKERPNSNTLHLLKTKEQPDKKAIKSYMESTGTVIPGYEVKEGEALSIRKAS